MSSTKTGFDETETETEEKQWRCRMLRALEALRREDCLSDAQLGGAFRASPGPHGHESSTDCPTAR